MATTVNLITVKVFGEHADYPLANISEATFGAWARETKVLLRGHAELARTRQVLEDAIAPEAKEALWAMLPNLENIEKSYPNATWSTATTEARITARTAWQMAWLDRVTTACAPDAIVRVLERLATITFGDSGKKTGWYSHDDVVQYMARVKRLENQLGEAFTTAVSDKQKLTVVEKALPESLRTIMKQSTPPPVNGVPHHETWQTALVRLGKAIKAVDETRIIAKALRVKRPSGDGKQDGRDVRETITDIRKKARKTSRERKEQRHRNHETRRNTIINANSRSGSKGNGGNRNGGNGGGGTVRFEGQCNTCKKFGHKSEDCWYKDSNSQIGNGGGRGGGKPGKGGGRGFGKGKNGRGGGRGGNGKATNTQRSGQNNSEKERSGVVETGNPTQTA